MIIFEKRQIFEYVSFSKMIGKDFNKVNNLGKSILIFAFENSYFIYRLSFTIKNPIIWKSQVKW